MNKYRLIPKKGITNDDPLHIIASCDQCIFIKRTNYNVCQKPPELKHCIDYKVESLIGRYGMVYKISYDETLNQCTIL